MGGDQNRRPARPATSRVITTLQSLLDDLTSGDDTLAEQAVPQLAALGGQAISDLAQLFKSTDSDIRWWALRTLAEIQVAEVSDYFIEGLQDTDLAVQQCAALALRQHPDRYAIPDLIVLLEHPDRLLIRLVADALIAIGQPATQSLLQVVQNNVNASARLQAVRALALIGDTTAISTLFHLLDGDSMLLEYWASLGLEKMGVGMTFFKP